MEEKIWHQSYASEVKRTLDYEKLTIPQALKRSADNFPNHTALNYMGKKINYSDLNGMVNRFARVLLSLGIKKVSIYSISPFSF